MLKAMAEAQVGDDVFGEDPTINKLEEMAADRLGKEAALFVASGTMGNLVSLLAHCGRGDEIILGNLSHTFFFEQGGSAAVGGLHPRTLANQPDGTLALSEIEAAVRSDNIHFPLTRLIVLENTHNLCGGHPLDIDYMQAVGDIARRHGLKIHVDGARFFNAAVALDVKVDQLAADPDSVSFCLSKGLAAPVGSVVCGSRDFIFQARRARKLADGLAEMAGLSIDPSLIKTDIVYFEVKRDDMTVEELVNKLAEQGVRMLPVGPGRIRAVTNYHITPDDIDYALGVFSKVMSV
jgi:threonine aldolase